MKHFVVTVAALAQLIIQPTLPGSSIPDYTQPAYQVQGQTIQPVLPNSTLPDLNLPSYQIQPTPPTLPSIPVVPRY